MHAAALSIAIVDSDSKCKGNNCGKVREKVHEWFPIKNKSYVGKTPASDKPITTKTPSRIKRRRTRRTGTIFSVTAFGVNRLDFGVAAISDSFPVRERLMIDAFQLVIGLQEAEQDQVGKVMHLVEHLLPGPAGMDIGLPIDFHH